MDLCGSGGGVEKHRVWIGGGEDIISGLRFKSVPRGFGEPAGYPWA